MKRSVCIQSSALALILSAVLAGCGSSTGSNGGTSGTSDPLPIVQGMWSIDAVSNQSNSIYLIYASLTQTQNSFFATSNSIVDSSLAN
jgi:hypothetical protein